MQLIQDILRRSGDSCEPRRTSRIRQADRFEKLAASSEVDPICPIWLTDRLSERERVSP